MPKLYGTKNTFGSKNIWLQAQILSVDYEKGFGILITETREKIFFYIRNTLEKVYKGELVWFTRDSVGVALNIKKERK